MKTPSLSGGRVSLGSAQRMLQPRTPDDLAHSFSTATRTPCRRAFGKNRESQDLCSTAAGRQSHGATRDRVGKAWRDCKCRTSEEKRNCTDKYIDPSLRSG